MGSETLICEEIGVHCTLAKFFRKNALLCLLFLCAKNEVLASERTGCEEEGEEERIRVGSLEREREWGCGDAAGAEGRRQQ